MAFIFAIGLLVREKLWVIGGLGWSNYLYHFAGDYLLSPIPKQPMGKNTDIRDISMYETSVSLSILIFSLVSTTIGLDALGLKSQSKYSLDTPHFRVCDYRVNSPF